LAWVIVLKVAYAKGSVFFVSLRYDSLCSYWLELVHQRTKDERKAKQKVKTRTNLGHS
jgi:hypothetical protein